MTSEFGNAHSQHSWGKRAEAAVELARQRIAQALGAEDPYQIVFTSGATEANQTILQMCRGRYWASPFEHSSIDKLAREDERVLEPDRAQPRSSEATRGEGVAPGGPDLLAWMIVNNETGEIFPSECLPPAHHYLRDATQAVGKIELPPLPAGFLTFSGHKIGAPKGIGALYSQSGDLNPLLLGEQESQRRGGTLNVAGIVGLGLATQLAIEETPQSIERTVSLRNLVLEGLQSTPDHLVHQNQHQSPHILAISFAGIHAEALVLELDHQGFAVSSGAACSSQSTEPSHVLLAKGIPKEYINGTVRISFGPTNTPASSASLGAVLASTVEKLRSLGANPS